MPSVIFPNCSDMFSTKELTKFRDELDKGGVMECYHQCCQRKLAAECTESSSSSCDGPSTAPISSHAPAPPPVDGNSTAVTAQVYAKSIIEKLAKDSAQDARLVRDFEDVKFAFVMQLRALFNWVSRLMACLYEHPTLETHRDITQRYHSFLLVFQKKGHFHNARGFVCMKAFVIVDDLIKQRSSKEGTLEYLGVVYYDTLAAANCCA